MPLRLTPLTQNIDRYSVQFGRVSPTSSDIAWTASVPDWSCPRCWLMCVSSSERAASHRHWGLRAENCEPPKHSTPSIKIYYNITTEPSDNRFQVISRTCSAIYYEDDYAKCQQGQRRRKSGGREALAPYIFGTRNQSAASQTAATPHSLINGHR